MKLGTVGPRRPLYLAGPTSPTPVMSPMLRTIRRGISVFPPDRHVAAITADPPERNSRAARGP